MSGTYKALQDHLVHLLVHVQIPTPIEDGAMGTWCDESFKVDEDRYARGFRDEAVVTCVRCLNNKFKGWIPPGALRDIIIANSVKDLQEATDAQFVGTIDAAIAASTTSAR